MESDRLFHYVIHTSTLACHFIQHMFLAPFDASLLGISSFMPRFVTSVMDVMYIIERIQSWYVVGL